MEWRIKLEAKTCFGEIHEVEIATLSRRTVSATDEDIGLSLAESKAILAALQHAIVTTQIDQYIACARVCKSCLAFLPIRDRRTRKLQPLFGTIEVCAPRIRVCACIEHHAETCNPRADPASPDGRRHRAGGQRLCPSFRCRCPADHRVGDLVGRR